MRRSVSDRLKVSKEGRRVSCFFWNSLLFFLSLSWPFFLSPSIFVVFVYGQKVGRRVEHHFSKRDRCGQKVGFSLMSRLCAVIFSSHRRSSAGDVPLSARSHVACVSNHRKNKLAWRVLLAQCTDKLALVTRFCVQLLFEREATSHSSSKTH